jgi:phosphatidylethanolamine-binding protein (PEBP) family uncharacterized protein
MNKLLVSVITILVLTGCETTKVDKNAAKLNVAFEWTEKSRCSRISPPITITNIPAETKFLDFRMVDQNMPSYNHGGGMIAFSGSSTIPEGALKSYDGPCPPGSPHRYEITVNALNDQKNTIIGKGSAVRAFPK